ncbi:MAG: hypothetical protein RL885_17255 [Planctomycetota bacterium]
MSIARLERVTLLGYCADKDEVLARLQDLGCLHVLPAHSEPAAPGPLPTTSRAKEALELLLTCPQKRKQRTDERHFDPERVERRVLDLKERLLALRDERDFLEKRISDVAVWGQFELPDLSDVAGQRLWFYVVPPHLMARFAETAATWTEVHRDNRHHYVVVLSETQPEGLPVPRTRTGQMPLEELRVRFEEVELEIEDLEAERSALTRWCRLLARNVDRLDDRATLEHVSRQTLDREPVFALLAWIPASRLPELTRYAEEAGLAVESRAPLPEDDPPTQLENAPLVSAGEQLVTFYMTPGYFTWDPSAAIFFSFTVFFAMIVSDAGYALVMALILARLWWRMAKTDIGRRLRVLFAALTAATFVYGVLTGSTFGIAPAEGSWLARLQLLDLKDSRTMMGLAVVVGGLHLMLANGIEAWRLRSSARALAPAGWVVALIGGFLAAGGAMDGRLVLEVTGLGLLAAGGTSVFLFAGAGERLGKRLLQGGLALTNVTKAFGDVLSYLRLFALGLATASLAAAFNEMGTQIRGKLPGVGLLLALLVWVIGHTLNFVLGLASGVIHGLRLNVIEFLDWSLHEEGKVFRPFRRKENLPWNR